MLTTTRSNNHHTSTLIPCACAPVVPLFHDCVAAYTLRDIAHNRACYDINACTSRPLPLLSTSK